MLCLMRCGDFAMQTSRRDRHHLYATLSSVEHPQRHGILHAARRLCLHHGYLLHALAYFHLRSQGRSHTLEALMAHHTHRPAWLLPAQSLIVRTLTHTSSANLVASGMTTEIISVTRLTGSSTKRLTAGRLPPVRAAHMRVA